MIQSVLEAIKIGNWNFEPEEIPESNYSATTALPGSKEKLEVLAVRLRMGQPLWHPNDRLDCSHMDSAVGY